MEKQVIHHLEKYDSIELELPAQITLISEAWWIGTVSLKNSKTSTGHHSFATLAS
jgi:hypothetical protein